MRGACVRPFTAAPAGRGLARRVRRVGWEVGVHRPPAPAPPACSAKTIPNPYLEVLVGEQARQTFITHESTKCLWNMTFSFDVALTPDEYSRATIRLRLRSANIMSRDDTLGVYAFTIKSVHTQTETPCQIIDTWVAVPDATVPSRVCGNVRLSVSVVGPWDNVNPAIMPNTDEPTHAAAASAASADALAALTAADPKVRRQCRLRVAVD